MSLYSIYDERIMPEANGGNLLQFGDPGTSIQDFKAANQIGRIINKNTKDEHFRLYLVGERSSKNYHVASEVGKKLSRSLLKSLKKIEADGKCIDGFTQYQIRVQPCGKVKLSVTLLSKVDLGTADYETRLKANYDVARLAIQGLYDINGILNVPPDVEHLLGLMEHHFGARKLFPDHASLAPLKSVGGLFKDLYDLLKVKISWPDYHVICLAIAIDMVGINWRTGVTDNHLLRETYYYNGSGYEYEVPHNTPTQQRLTSAQKAALKAIYLTSRDPRGLTDDEAKIIDVHKMLTFLRNRYAHRLEAIAAWEYTWKQQRFDFRASHSELVTLVKFPRVLSVIQYHLYQLGVLDEPDLL